MFQLDDSFLNDVGLGGLPEEQKKPFLQHIYSELEIRVGTRLSDGLSDEQLEEFGQIIDKEESVINNWLQKFSPNFQNDDMFIRLNESAGDSNETIASLKAEYAATKWLEINRPDYKNVVAEVMNELKQEVVANRDAIIGNTAA